MTRWAHLKCLAWTFLRIKHFHEWKLQFYTLFRRSPFAWHQHFVNKREIFQALPLNFVRGASEKPPVKPFIFNSGTKHRVWDLHSAINDLFINLLIYRQIFASNFFSKSPRGGGEGRVDCVYILFYSIIPPSTQSWGRTKCWLYVSTWIAHQIHVEVYL